MTDDTTNLFLEQLRAIRGKLDRHSERFDHIDLRLSSIETTLVGMRKDIANSYGDIISQNSRFDLLERRLERIEIRLNLVNGETPGS